VRYCGFCETDRQLYGPTLTITGQHIIQLYGVLSPGRLHAARRVLLWGCHRLPRTMHSTASAAIRQCHSHLQPYRWGAMSRGQREHGSSAFSTGEAATSIKRAHVDRGGDIVPTHAGTCLIIGGHEEKDDLCGSLHHGVQTAKADRGSLVLITAATAAPGAVAATYQRAF